MEEAGVTLTDETFQTMYDFILMKKSMKSTKASSPPSATQEVKSLPTTHVEPQPKVDSEEEGSDEKNKTEQVEHVTEIARAEEHKATLDSLPPSTVKKERTPPKSDVNPQPEIDSEEEEANEKEKETDLPVDEEWSQIEPPPDVMKSTKRKRRVVKKEGATSTSSRDKERNVKRQKYDIEHDDEYGGEIKESPKSDGELQPPTDSEEDITSDEEHKTDSPDVVKSTKRKRRVVKKEHATSTSSRDKERNVKCKKTLHRA
jgi:hypothetical protein